MQQKLSVMREAALGLVSVRMSPTAFHLDYFVYPPLILVLLITSVRSIPAWQVALAVAFGLAVWTLAEYLLHRFTLHYWPYFSTYHQAHHDEPRAMIGSPTLFSFGFFSLIALLPAWALVGAPLAFAGFAGFLAGYLAFAAVHEAVHHAEGQGALLRHFKRLHAIHHHGDSSRNFGVLTGFWDHVFGTYADKPGKRAGTT